MGSLEPQSSSSRVKRDRQLKFASGSSEGDSRVRERSRQAQAEGWQAGRREGRPGGKLAMPVGGPAIRPSVARAGPKVVREAANVCRRRGSIRPTLWQHGRAKERRIEGGNPAPPQRAWTCRLAAETGAMASTHLSLHFHVVFSTSATYGEPHHSAAPPGLNHFAALVPVARATG